MKTLSENSLVKPVEETAPKIKQEQEIRIENQEQPMRPLLVDLDRTFIKTDVFLETLILFLKEHPRQIFQIFRWLSKGVAHLKHQLATHTSLDVGALPINPDFFKYLKKEKNHRPVILFTAANELLAERINTFYQLFSEVHASTSNVNFGPRAKLQRIQEMGLKEFDYAGDRRADMIIFNKSVQAIVVNPSFYLSKIKGTDFAAAVYDQQNHWRVLLSVFAGRGWWTNFFVFLAPLSSLNFDAGVWLGLMHAFLMFSAINIALNLIYEYFSAMDARSAKIDLSKSSVYAGDLSIADGSLLIAFSFTIATAILLWSGSLPLLLIVAVQTGLMLGGFARKANSKGVLGRLNLITGGLVKSLAGFI